MYNSHRTTFESPDAGSRAKGPLGGLYVDKFLKEDIWFPLEREHEELSHFLQFQAKTYERRHRKAKSTVATKANIFLPIPGNLTDNWQVGYNNVELGTFGGGLEEQLNNIGADAKALAGNVLSAESFDDLVTAGQKLFEHTDVGSLATKAVTSMIKNVVSAAGEFSKLPALQVIQLKAGIAINPHLATLFQGVGFKSHSFAYKLNAKTARESEMIRKIIDAFKFHMLPNFSAVAGSTLFDFPDEWFLRFGSDANQKAGGQLRSYLYSFRPCVLTGFSVNYNGQNLPIFFEDTKAPVDIEIQLQFQEVEVVTKETLRDEFKRRDLHVKESKQRRLEIQKAAEKAALDYVL